MFVCPECGESHETGGFCTRDGTQLSDVGDDPILGTKIGAYQLARLIGIGGMGRVYKGVNPTIGSRVAIKVLSRDCAHNPELVERFFAEAKAVNLIRHENIVNVLDLAQLPDRRPYIVMEFLDGAPLSRVIAERKPLPLGSLARLMGEVLSALGAAHSKGIVHRDLKPDNIFVTPHGRAKVLDFGIAKLQLEQSGRSAPTRDGSLMGTPHYMAPEQAQARPVTPQTDIYAAGCILFEGACGRPPFAAEALYDLLRMQVEQPPPPPRSLRPYLPPEYEAVILRAMAKDPAQRQESARALYHELVNATRGLPDNAWAPVGDAENQLTVGMSAVPTPAGPTPHHPQAYAPTHTPQRPQQPVPPTSPTPSTAGELVRPMQPAPPRSRGLLVGIIVGVLAIAGIAVAAVVSSQSGEATSAEGASDDDVDASEVDTVAAADNPDTDADGERQRADSASDPKSDQTEAKTDRPEAPPQPTGEPTRPQVEATGAGRVDGNGNANVEPKPSARGSMPMSNPSAFDVTGFIPKATAIAKRIFPDAVLTRIDASGVRPNGRAELTLDDGFTVLYRFVSPSRMKRPRDLPVGVEHKPTCMYYVYANSKAINYYPIANSKCDMALIGAPKCSAQQIWRKAAAKGAPTRNAVASIGFWADPKGKARWYFSIPDVSSNWIPDNC